MFPKNNEKSSTDVNNPLNVHYFHLDKMVFFRIIVLALLYFFSGRLGQLMAIPPGNVTPVWPPSGIGLAAIYLWGYRVWPGIFFGAFIANTWSIISFSNLGILLNVIAAGSSIGIGASLQAIVGAYFINYIVTDENLFLKVKNVVFFLIIGILSCLINSIIGSTSLLLSGFVQKDAYFNTWLTWYLGDFAGVIIVTPLLISWIRTPLTDWTFKRIMEGLLLLILTIVILTINLKSTYPILYTVIPLLVWAAIRFETAGSTMLIFLTSIIVVMGTAKGIGPFSFTSLNQSLLLLQLFIVIVTSMTLILAAVINERQKAEKSLEEYSHGLEVLVEERTKELKDQLIRIQQMQQQLIIQEKLASVGVLTAGIAHEINNPINFVLSGISSLRQDFNDLLKIVNKYAEISHNNVDEKFKELAELKKEIDLNLMIPEISNLISGIENGAERTSKIVQDLRTFSRLDELDLKKVNIHEGIDAAITLLKSKYGDRIVIAKNYGNIPDIECYPGKINQAFLNILLNAIQAIPEKGEIQIKTARENDKIKISIKDNGVGISPENQKKIFLPFFTTRPIGGGLGLGLATTLGIINEHHGTIEVTSELGKGTEIVITLPLYLD